MIQRGCSSSSHHVGITSKGKEDAGKRKEVLLETLPNNFCVHLLSQTSVVWPHQTTMAPAIKEVDMPEATGRLHTSGYLGPSHLIQGTHEFQEST